MHTRPLRTKLNKAVWGRTFLKLAHYHSIIPNMTFISAHAPVSVSPNVTLNSTFSVYFIVDFILRRVVTN